MRTDSDPRTNSQMVSTSATMNAIRKIWVNERRVYPTAEPSSNEAVGLDYTAGRRMLANMDSPKNLPDEWVSNSGWALLWIDGILLVPAIFGALFLPPVPRLLVLGVGIAIAATFGILYSRARAKP
jgi:hypothetical protein